MGREVDGGLVLEIVKHGVKVLVERYPSRRRAAQVDARGGRGTGDGGRRVIDGRRSVVVGRCGVYGGGVVEDADAAPAIRRRRVELEIVERIHC